MKQLGLFGDECSTRVVPRKHSGRRIGYAARPGTGPKGRRCNTCVSCLTFQSPDGRFRRCELVAPLWDRGAAADIKHNAPACRFWVRKPFEAVREGGAA